MLLNVNFPITVNHERRRRETTGDWWLEQDRTGCTSIAPLPVLAPLFFVSNSTTGSNTGCCAPSFFVSFSPTRTTGLRVKPLPLREWALGRYELVCSCLNKLFFPRRSLIVHKILKGAAATATDFMTSSLSHIDNVLCGYEWDGSRGGVRCRVVRFPNHYF